MGVIILLTSFDRFGIQELLLGKLAGKIRVYDGFEPNWYVDCGNKICLSIFMSSFVLNLKELIGFFITVAKRCKDRSFKLNIKLDPEDLDCDKPNTKIRIQADLEKLYIGKEFKGEKNYSRMMSTLFVILMYSGGMPIMYLIGFVFYFITFVVNKFLMINYFKKSRTLTRTVPLFSMDFLQYGLFLHYISGFFILTNPQAFVTRSKKGKVKPIIDPKKLLKHLGIEDNNENKVAVDFIVSNF